MTLIQDSANMYGKIVLKRNGMQYRIDDSPMAQLGDKLFTLIQVSKKQEDGSLALVGHEIWNLREYYPNATRKNIWNVRFPSNEDFGTHGWSFKTKEAAMKKFEELTQ